MYGIVLLAALSATQESAGIGWKGYPTPEHHSQPYPWCGYPTLNGGYNWPGYACWGGCGGYASAAYGVPMTPIVNPLPPYRLEDEDKDRKKGKDDGNGMDKPGGKKKPAPDDEYEPPKKKPPTNPEDNDEASAVITIYLPAGAKLSVDGKPVNASGVKSFVTPALEKGYAYYYEVTIEVERDGKPEVERRRLVLRPGESVHADYRDVGGGVASRR